MLTARNNLRKQLAEKRRSLSLERRNEAKESLFSTLTLELKKYTLVASFSSLKEEIDLSSLNKLLANDGRLLLPKREASSLVFYKVHDLTSLKCFSGDLLEPDPSLCPRVLPSEIPCILVPGLGFDETGMRIGYGKGYYDRFLKEVGDCLMIGVGFKEQLTASLPCQAHDVRLDRILLL